MNASPSAVTALAFLCHLDDSTLGREAIDLAGKSGEKKQSSCALLPHISKPLVGDGVGGGLYTTHAFN